MGIGLAAPAKNPTLALGPLGLVSMGLKVQPITELATLLMIDFKCRPILSSYFSFFFPVSEDAVNGLGDEGADGAMPPQNFGARTAPFNTVIIYFCIQ